MFTYKYRLLPIKSQEKVLESWLEQCRFLYNHLLGERKNAYETQKKSLNMYGQMATFTKLKKVYPNLKTVYSQVLQNVAVRVDLAYQAFFRRIRQKETPGYPRFKGEGRYDSFCFPQIVDNFIITKNYVHLPKIGNVYFVKHREILGNLKTITVKRTSTEKWFLFVVTDYVKKLDVPDSNLSTGIDVGIENFATFSDGSLIKNPRFFETDQKELHKRQRKNAKIKSFEDASKIKLLKNHVKKLSKKRTRHSVSRIYERISNRRNDFGHKNALNVVRKYKNICVEDIKINKLIQKRWCSKQISDAAWGQFFNILICKAGYAGRNVVKVNPAYTSQTCSKCGTRTVHELKDRIFSCSCCKNTELRDLNAAKNILRLGLQSLA